MKKKFSIVYGSLKGSAAKYTVHSSEDLIKDGSCSISSRMEAISYDALSISCCPYLTIYDAEPSLSALQLIRHYHYLIGCCPELNGYDQNISSSDADILINDPELSNYDLDLIRFLMETTALGVQPIRFTLELNSTLFKQISYSAKPIGRSIRKHGCPVGKLHFSVHGCHNIIHGPPFQA